MENKARSGFIYVLTHPLRENLYKIGVTTQDLSKSIAQHNSNFSTPAGKIVKETGQKWTLKESHAVVDTYTAKAAFWSATGIADIPFRGGVDIFPMDWKTIQIGFEAAKKSGVRKKAARKVKYNREWMVEELEGTSISHIGSRFNHVQYTEFQCINGHVFKAIPRQLANNIKCPICNIR